MANYNRLNEYLENKYKTRTLKICINGGFSCPNRDGTKGTNGCIFCLDGGSLVRENNLNSIKKQVEDFMNSYKAERASKFIVYFQEYTNTYGPIDELKRKYDEALEASSQIVALDIDTRADCINEDVVKLLSSYKERVDVIVEIGLQTANENTHKYINQNITNEDVEKACKLLKENGIEVVLHMMVDLPNETHSDVIETIKFINKIKPNGIKIHNTYVLEGTRLATLYRNNEYIPMSKDDYVDEVIYIITHLDKDIVIHRIVGDAPSDKLIAPQWVKNKKVVMNQINNMLDYNKLEQGMYCK